ncbi:MAG: hypothetical protein AAFX87_03875 [Bacteroidota bacterium]
MSTSASKYARWRLIIMISLTIGVSLILITIFQALSGTVLLDNPWTGSIGFLLIAFLGDRYIKKKTRRSGIF